MTQRPWTPTKRRGPIAAEYSSPGPACVTLPPLIGNFNFFSSLIKIHKQNCKYRIEFTGKTVPDSKRGRAPAFSFGSRYASSVTEPLSSEIIDF